jgi:general secretion pathway protein G
MRKRSTSACVGSAAFTLIELLVVVAVIAILAGLTLGFMRGATERAKRGQAAAELATIATALESYQRQYGDYPRTDSGAELLQALIGRRGPTGAPMPGRSFLATAHFSTNGDPDRDAAAILLDPWGNPYFYRYAPPGDATYVLLSVGPDGESANDPADPEPSVNWDNLPAKR